MHTSIHTYVFAGPFLRSMAKSTYRSLACRLRVLPRCRRWAHRLLVLQVALMESTKKLGSWKEPYTSFTTWTLVMSKSEAGNLQPVVFSFCGSKDMIVASEAPYFVPSSYSSSFAKTILHLVGETVVPRRATSCHVVPPRATCLRRSQEGAPLLSKCSVYERLASGSVVFQSLRGWSWVTRSIFSSSFRRLADLLTRCC